MLQRDFFKLRIRVKAAGLVSIRLTCFLSNPPGYLVFCYGLIRWLLHVTDLIAFIEALTEPATRVARKVSSKLSITVRCR